MTKTVKIPFDYNYNNGTPVRFEAGQTLPADLEHDAFALAHTTHPPYVPKKPGTPEAALEDYQRRQRAIAAATVADHAADVMAEERAKAAEVERLQAVVRAVTGDGETQEERAAAQVRTMAYQMPQDRDEAAAATRPVVAAEPTPVPITTKYVPLTDASLDRARAEATQASKTRKRA